MPWPGPARGGREDAMSTRILVLATGGTIAGQADNSASARYVAGELGIDQLLASVGDFSRHATIAAEQIANIGSEDMSGPIWGKLLQRIGDAFENDTADAVIVTHGTDTIEETAFLLDLALPAGRPVVLVAAMRPANALGADGPRNLANAIRLAADPGSPRRGVMVVLGDFAYAARDVSKATTVNVEAFRGFPHGPIAQVQPSALRFLTAGGEAAWRGRYAFPHHGQLPPVAILHAHANMDDPSVHAMLSCGLAGVVLAGLGHGNAPKQVYQALASASAAGLMVVRASQVGEGAAPHGMEIDDKALGFIAGSVLSPRKCRILLQMLLANGIRAHAECQRVFDQF